MCLVEEILYEGGKVMEMDFASMFFSVLFAFICKDLYDIFIQEHIKRWLKKSKTIIDPNNNRNDYEDEDEYEYGKGYKEERR